MEDKEIRLENDEITLKELIEKLIEFWRELWKYWWLIALISIPVALYLGFKAYKQDLVYPAPLTFMVTKDSGNSLGQFSGLLGTFGFGTGAKGEYNLDKMMQLLKSRRITENALFKEVEIGGRKDLLGNHFIHHLDTLEEWSAKPGRFTKEPDPIADFRFENPIKRPLSIEANTALKKLHSKIVGSENTSALLESGYNEDSGILNINFPSRNEELSIALTTIYFEELSNWYTQKTIEKQKITHDLVKHKTDSLYSELQSTEIQLANLVESSRGIFSPKEKLKEQRLNREIQKLTLMYGESAKNLEIADFTLKSKTPNIQLIDEPVSPIKGIKDSTLIALIKGGLIGVLIGIFIVIGRKILRDAMQNS